MADKHAEIRTFSTLLGYVDDGALAHEANSELTSLLNEMRDHAKTGTGKSSGKVTITLEFKQEADLVEVRGEVKSSKPKPVRGKSIFWTTLDGTLSLANPHQPDMFRDVKAPSTETKTV